MENPADFPLVRFIFSKLVDCTRNYPYTNTLGIIELKKNINFKTDKIDNWDYLSILIYLMITFVIYMDPNEIIGKKAILAYSYITPAFLYVFNYKSLRKIYIWAIWIIISIIHIWLYNEVSEISKYNYYRGPASEFLNYTSIFLILFQILRILSIKIGNKELVAPNVSGIDLWDKRKVTTSDYICFTIYFGFYILLGILISE